MVNLVAMDCAWIKAVRVLLWATGQDETHEGHVDCACVEAVTINGMTQLVTAHHLWSVSNAVMFWRCQIWCCATEWWLDANLRSCMNEWPYVVDKCWVCAVVCDVQSSHALETTMTVARVHIVYAYVVHVECPFGVNCIIDETSCFRTVIKPCLKS